MNSDQPYLHRIKVKVIRQYNPDYGEDRMCKCGHLYHRHFDSWEDNRACGCKYCSCYTFEEVTPEHCFAIVDIKDNSAITKFNTEADAWNLLYNMGEGLRENLDVRECKWEDTFVPPPPIVEYDEDDDY